MTIRLFLLIIAFLSPAVSGASDSHHSKYAGEENRAIKSLSQSDIEELQRGGGWGLAKAAELNGVPGPVHILEMADKIGLTDAQREQIENLYQQMQREAVALGERFIQLEAALNDAFNDGSITQLLLEKRVSEIETLRAELRIVHLSAHLKTPRILTSDQIALYNQLRGYGKDPCQNIPEGHNAAMWKQHNGCN